MSRLTAPYNFVPLNHDVVQPHWADKVSMDVPFAGAISGHIDLVIEAVTSLILGGATEAPPEGADQPSRKHRASLFGQDFLPGTSIKGCLRAVLEIATLGKIGRRIDNQRFAVRDLHNAHLYTSRLTEMFRPLSRAGWLRLDADSGDWFLEPCDYSVVRQSVLEGLYQSLGGAQTKPYLGKAKASAEDKYKIWAPASLEVSFTPDEWRARDDWAKGRILSRADDVGTGKTRGTLVFTGQPQDRKTGKKPKGLDFIFHSPTGANIEVPATIREDFEHIHRDPNNKTPNADWGYWRRHLLSGRRVPVFWLAEDTKGERIGAMGLAMMFRLAYNRTTRDLAETASPKHLTDVPDFAETLFGYVREDKGKDQAQALHGRVQIEPARLEHSVAEERERLEILLNPKPSFYPAYVAQRHLKKGSDPLQVLDGTYASADKARPSKAFNTYMDKDAELRGWKRYPATSQVRQSPKPTLKKGVPDVLSKKVLTRFTPLGAGSRFRTTLHLHNVRREELGALLWVITFGGREDTHRHTLGMAKPLGYGCVKMTLDHGTAEFDDVDNRTWTGPACVTLFQDCLQAFRSFMNREVKDWENSPQVRHLLAMADPALGDRKVKAGELAAMDGPTPFQDAKKSGLVLKDYLGDPSAWPTQAPPPSAGPEQPGPKPGAPGKAGGKAAAPAAKKLRKAWVDGEPVTILSQQGDEYQVQFEDRSIEFIPTDEVELEVE